MSDNMAVERPKMLKQAKESVLKEWDISFSINGEVLVNVLSYLVEINTDVMFKFYKDKIFMHQKSPDNVQYAEVEISSSDVLDYNPGIDGDPNRKDAKVVIDGTDGKFKPVLVDIKGTLGEIETFSTKDSIITVKIDSCYYKRVEFHCSQNVIIWAQLMDPSGVLKTIDRLPEVVKKVRNNPDIKKATVIIEPATFATICNVGGKDKKRDIDKRAFIELDRTDGLVVTSGDKLKGRIFGLRPTDVSTQIGDYGTGGIEGDKGFEEFVAQDLEAEDLEEDLGGPADFAPGKEDFGKDKKKAEKKRPENKGQLDQLLGIDVDVPQYVYLEKDFIVPFTKLKGLSPIVIEVRTDKPVVLEQKPYNGIVAILTIAPRIESEEDK